ncbi:MAG: EVE domain-containing protein, partial [Candidatus Binatia bacterium]
MKYWLVKSEPDKYSWDDLVKEGRDHWDGVRNYQARNNLRAMKIADRVLFYHSVKGKAVVGVAKVVREAYQDPTTADQRWSAVDLEPVAAFSSPVTLSEIKAHPALGNMALLR